MNGDCHALGGGGPFVCVSSEVLNRSASCSQRCFCIFLVTQSCSYVPMGFLVVLIAQIVCHTLYIFNQSISWNSPVLETPAVRKYNSPSQKLRTMWYLVTTECHREQWRTIQWTNTRWTMYYMEWETWGCSFGLWYRVGAGAKAGVGVGAEVEAKARAGAGVGAGVG